MGVDEMEFYEAIESFKGAAKRLERIAAGKRSYLFKDFAHAPSKVAATVKAVREQFIGFTTIGCLELHTYSSLDPTFLPNYKECLAGLDKAIVFYDPAALKIKGRSVIAVEEIKEAFGHPNLEVYTEPASLHQYLLNQNYDRSVLLMMSSGNYGGLNWDQLSKVIV